MKTIKSISLFIAAIFLFSCEGPIGPPGEDGLDGVNILGSIIEIEGDFTAANEYLLYYQFPSDFEIYSTDVVMVYILWEQVNINGTMQDVWRALPQTIVLQEGILQYNFDYTVEDIQIFLDGDIDFSTLLPAEKDDQVFRIAVLPADITKNNSIDLNNLDAVMNSLQIDLSSIEKVDLVKPKG